jgi:hypothetical protein
MGKSEAVLAAKDMVDSVQDMLEKVSKMQNEQMPALVDTIRDQIGSEQAEQFKGAMAPLLTSLYQAVSTGRDQADTAVRGLAGEETEQPMDMGMDMGADTGLDAAAPADAGAELGPEPESDLDAADGFDATDAAVGGEQELGRERR